MIRSSAPVPTVKRHRKAAAKAAEARPTTCPTVILPALRCPNPECGAVDRDGEGEKRQQVLRCVGSRIIGETRQAYYVCRQCGKSFRVEWTLNWTPGGPGATALVTNI